MVFQCAFPKVRDGEHPAEEEAPDEPDETCRACGRTLVTVFNIRIPGVKGVAAERS